MERAAAVIDLTGNEIKPAAYFQPCVPLITQPIVPTFLGPMIVTPKVVANTAVPIAAPSANREHEILMSNRDVTIPAKDFDIGIKIRCATAKECILVTRQHSTKQVCAHLHCAQLHCAQLHCAQLHCAQLHCAQLSKPEKIGY